MGKGQSVAGLVCGIVSLTICWLGYFAFAALPLAIVGLILSVVGGKKLKANGQKSGVATAGLVIGIIAVVICSIAFVTCGLCVACIASATAAL